MRANPPIAAEAKSSPDSLPGIPLEQSGCALQMRVENMDQPTVRPGTTTIEGFINYLLSEVLSILSFEARLSLRVPDRIHRSIGRKTPSWSSKKLQRSNEDAWSKDFDGPTSRSLTGKPAIFKYN